MELRLKRDGNLFKFICVSLAKCQREVMHVK
jgi:hypothetical protein